jgi:hypothetical protein
MYETDEYDDIRTSSDLFAEMNNPSCSITRKETIKKVLDKRKRDLEREKERKADAVRREIDREYYDPHFRF